jgi:hypothetical protein
MHRESRIMRSKRAMGIAAAAVCVFAASALWLKGSERPAESTEVGEQQPLGFFITSAGPGNGGDLGGLDGADAFCQSLAEAVGSGDRNWRAYLSTQADGNSEAVNARDRIGEGPWYNAAGVMIASGVDDLHYNNANVSYEHALNERGEKVNSGVMGDSPNFHDILTGTHMDGTAFPRGEDRTCGNWTRSTGGSAFVGHHDRYTRQTPGASWNSVHPSRGCSQEDFVATGGAGLFYCFAVE